MNTLLIIDGLNLVRRLHAAQPDETDMISLQHRINNACNKLIHYHQPSHVTIVWDGDQESWRKKLYHDYKKGRKPMPECLAKGMALIKENLTALSINSIHAQEEADDVIATLATKLSQHGGQAIIVSTDKGFSQLSDPNILQWDHFNQSYYDVIQLENKFGIHQHQLLDFFALAGDSGNKIPGVTGIGIKTAAELLQNYGSLKNIYASIDDIDEKHAKKLNNGKEMARMSYKLAKLKTNIQLHSKLSDFRIKKHN